ncbi:threonine--tRNA ligase [Spiroplasma endosymbiont of Amphibalanus improvisus]|uniref:threonine--tRNA ligase n=1 Tax=Spiroplasma endosymbiont of Amphibalanus improvisus TaxID=3066327 RepID=UPI00313C48DD
MKIKLKDGNKKVFNIPMTVVGIARNISISLSKRTLAGIVDGELVSSEYLISKSCELKFVTTEEPESITVLNNTGSIMLALALSNMDPDIQIAEMNLNDDGFYVDFKMSKESIKEEDLPFLEKKMKRISSDNYAFERFKEIKTDGLNDFQMEVNKEVKRGLVSNGVKLLTKYPFAKFSNVKASKLFSVAGVYWNNDKNNEMIQRIYGYSTFDKDQLSLKIQEKDSRKEQDHRTIGKKLEIFSFENLVGQGLPIWLPNGKILKDQIKNFIKQKEWEYDFIEVETPILGSKKLYETSGHWEHYKDDMFPLMKLNTDSLVLRPMSCPHHIAIYKSKLRSYRDFPIRFSEHAILSRFESSGSLSGLERVRMMELTDSHIFVRPDQIKDEFKHCFKMIEETLKVFNIQIDYYSLSLRDPKNKAKYFNDDKMWNHAEQLLKEALNESKINYKEMIGEAAFYGPKLDIQIKTALNHEVTISTLQFDFLLPDKFDASYINEKGTKTQPIIIHRGLIGTYERFIAILLEQTKGNLPLWLAPCQIDIIPVSIAESSKHLEYAHHLRNEFKKEMLRSKIDSRDERLSYKIRESQTKKVPYQLVIGDNEVKNKMITYRQYGNEETKTITLLEFIKTIKNKLKN